MRLILAADEGDVETVVTLAADRLDRRRLDPGLVGKQLMETALGGDRGIVVACVNETTVADDVVGDDQAARASVLEGPAEVRRSVDLVGVDEDQVKGTGFLGVEPGKLIERRSEPDLGDVAEPGPLDVLLGDLGIALLRLERDQATAGRQRPPQPDRAVTAEGAELEDRPRLARLRQQVQQLALGRRDLDRRQARRVARPQRGLERLVVGSQQARYVVVDGSPSLPCHGGRSIRRITSRKPSPVTERAGMETASRRARRRERWIERAERASDAFGLVLALVLVTYVLASLLTNRGWDAVILTVATSVTSVVSLISSHVQARVVRVVVLLSAITILLAMVSASSGDHAWLELASAIQVSLLAVAMGAVLRRVLTAPEIGSRTILGALSVYAVLGILFTFLYGAIDRIQPGAFFEGVPHPQGSDFLFFSYTTLTTTGYGNLVPGGQPGRMIAGLEMMVGQIFLVTLVAGLVSLWRPGDAIRRRREQRQDKASADLPADS